MSATTSKKSYQDEGDRKRVQAKGKHVEESEDGEDDDDADGDDDDDGDLSKYDLSGWGDEDDAEPAVEKDQAESKVKKTTSK